MGTLKIHWTSTHRDAWSDVSCLLDYPDYKHHFRGRTSIEVIGVETGDWLLENLLHLTHLQGMRCDVVEHESEDEESD
jgi:hypothetical protein